MSEQERIEKLKVFVDEIADCDELNEKQVHQIVELCDIEWDAQDMLELTRCMTPTRTCCCLGNGRHLR